MVPWLPRGSRPKPWLPRGARARDPLPPTAPRAVLGLGLCRLRLLRPAEGVRSTVNLSLHCVFLGQCVFLGRGLTLCSCRR